MFQPSRFSKAYRPFTIVSLSLISHLSYSANTGIQPKIKSTAYAYETKVNTEDNESNYAVVIEPSLLGTYSSKGLTAAMNVSHTRVAQKNEDAGASKQFTNLAYNSRAVLVENVLDLSLTGSQSYRAINQGQSYVSDSVLSSGDLTKYSSHSAALTFATPNPEYVGVNAQTSYSQTKTDATTTSSTGINGDNLAASMQIYQGRQAQNYTFMISANYNDTGRSSFQDFQSTLINGIFTVAIGNQANFVLLGSSRDYNVDLEEGIASRSNLDSTSYGAGVEWSPSNSRSITVTYNQLEESDRITNYAGLNVNWAFSSRTGVRFNYDKKFYGDAYDFSFNYKLKNISSSITYGEKVSSLSRLSLVSDTGVFVCQIGSLDFESCFQPDSTDYTLAIDEEFISIDVIETDITEQVTFRKSGKFNIGYDKRKIKLAASVSYSNIEYLESNVVNETRSANLGLNYKLGRNANISLSTNISQTLSSASNSDSRIKTVTLTFNRNVKQNFSWNVSTRLLDRDSNVASRNIVDKRITLGATYTF